MFWRERARLPDSICQKIVPGNSLTTQETESDGLVETSLICVRFALWTQLYERKHVYHYRKHLVSGSVFSVFFKYCKN